MAGISDEETDASFLERVFTLEAWIRGLLILIFGTVWLFFLMVAVAAGSAYAIGQFVAQSVALYIGYRIILAIFNSVFK